MSDLADLERRARIAVGRGGDATGEILRDLIAHLRTAASEVQSPTRDVRDKASATEPTPSGVAAPASTPQEPAPTSAAGVFRVNQGFVAFGSGLGAYTFSVRSPEDPQCTVDALNAFLSRLVADARREAAGPLLRALRTIDDECAAHWPEEEVEGAKEGIRAIVSEALDAPGKGGDA